MGSTVTVVNYSQRFFDELEGKPIGGYPTLDDYTRAFEAIRRSEAAMSVPFVPRPARPAPTRAMIISSSAFPVGAYCSTSAMPSYGLSLSPYTFLPAEACTTRLMVVEE